MRPPLMIAGACGYGCWPENSLIGFARSLEAGVDGVEIDVHLSADGRVVLYHDYRLDPERTRRGGAWLERPTPALTSLTLAELRGYEIGRMRPGGRYAESHADQEQIDGVMIGTLEDALALLAPSPTAQIYIEIKTSPQQRAISSDPAALTGAVIDVLEAHGLAARARVIAFEWQVLRLLRDRAPHIAASHLSIPPALQTQIARDADGASPWADGCDPARFGGSVPRAIAAHGGTCWSAHFAELTEESIAEARDLGLAIAAWNLSRADDIARFAAMGLDSLTVSGPVWRAP